MIRDVHPSQDPGSGSATLITGMTFCLHGLVNELISHCSVSYGDG